MKDLYKRLELPPAASEQVIRQGVSSADSATRADAEAILLEPRRRKVYDRNRAILITIAQLRLELGLNYTRFWSRREFKDFWQVPQIVAPPSRPGQPVDKMMIARAFHAAKHHTRRHAARWGRWVLGGACAAALLALAAWRLKG